jgi:hypothetical protein
MTAPLLQVEGLAKRYRLPRQRLLAPRRPRCRRWPA